MSINFLRGNPQAPKGHAIFVARSTSDPQQVFCTYCIVPPTPLSLSKYIPSFLAAQISPEELQDAHSVPVMPIPPMLEEGSSLEHLERLAEYRDDDLVEIGSLNPRDESARMQLVGYGCQEYGQLYMENATEMRAVPDEQALPAAEELPVLDELDTEELLIQSMTERQRLSELSKLVGTVRYALGGKDNQLLQEAEQRMQLVARFMPEKYRSAELITAATNPQDRGERLAELYVERGYKLLDEEYADIPDIERSIRDLQ
jgi:hypothetical protein